MTEARCPHCDFVAAVMTPDAVDVVSDESLSIIRGIVGTSRSSGGIPVVLPESDRQSYICPACGEAFKPVSRRVSRLRFPDV